MKLHEPKHATKRCLRAFDRRLRRYLVRRLTFQLTGTLRRADFGLGFRAQNWTAAKCPVERRVRRRPREQLKDGTAEFKMHYRKVGRFLHSKLQPARTMLMSVAQDVM